jgi:hypothetical protein
MGVFVYPIVTTLLYVLSPLTPDWAIWQRTLLLTPATVASIIFFVSPLVTKHLGRLISRLPHDVALGAKTRWQNSRASRPLNSRLAHSCERSVQFRLPD